MTNTERFATVRLRRPFVRWLRMEAARRETFIYEILEDLAARSLGDKTPWLGKRDRLPRSWGKRDRLAARPAERRKKAA